MSAVVLALSQWAIPVFLIFTPIYALFKGVDVYNVFCDGAARGLRLLVQILPFLLGMLVAIEVFNASGAMQLALAQLQPLWFTGRYSAFGCVAFAFWQRCLGLVRPDY